MFPFSKSGFVCIDVDRKSESVIKVTIGKLPSHLWIFAYYWNHVCNEQGDQNRINTVYIMNLIRNYVEAKCLFDSKHWLIFIDGISKITTTLHGNRGKYVIYAVFDAIETLTLYQIAFVSWLINEACKIAHTLYFTFWGIHTYKRKIHLSLLTSFSKVAKGSKKFPKCIFSIWLMEEMT